MITADLKLLVDIAWANRHGQTEYHLVRGESAAADRLVRRGFLFNGGEGRIGLTEAGELLVKQLVDRVKRGDAK